MSDTSFKKFTSIDKFADSWLMMQKQEIGQLKFRSKIKLHGCFSKNALVTLANGEQEEISKLDTGTSILSYNENTQEVEFDEITQVISQDLDKEWIKLFFDDGTYVECTEDHLFLTKNRGWVEASKLTDKDIFVKLP